MQLTLGCAVGSRTGAGHRPYSEAFLWSFFLCRFVLPRRRGDIVSQTLAVLGTGQRIFGISVSACQLGRVLCNSRAGCRGRRAALWQCRGGQTPSHRLPYTRFMSSPGAAQKKPPWRSVTCDCSACPGKGVVQEHGAQSRPLPVGRACVIWSLAETICLRSHRLLNGAAAIQKKAWGCRR